MLEGKGVCARFILVLHEFNVTGSLGSPPRQRDYSPWFHGSIVGDCLPFREAELKPITFSSLLLFHVFLSFLFS